MAVKRIIFIRPGETDWNRERRVQGQVNVPLNARGLTQARRAGEMLRGKGIQTICTSPLDRALISAEINDNDGPVETTLMGAVVFGDTHEGDDLVFTATLGQTTDVDVEVAVTLSSGTATSGTDFSAGPFYVTIDADQVVPAVRPIQGSPETDRTFRRHLR